MIYRLTSVPDGAITADNIEYAGSLWQKGVGLLGRRRLTVGQGLWLPGVNSIHTFGMSVPIDVLFLDKAFRTTGMLLRVNPWRICIAPPATVHCLELAAGTLVGDLTRLQSAAWLLEARA